MDVDRLLDAVSAGELQVVAELLARRPALAAAHGRDGQTALHAAAQHNDARIAALLVAHGADVHAMFGQSGHSALSWAVTCNALDCARTLVQLGAEPDLFCAAGMGLLEHVRASFDAAGALLPGSSRTGSSRFGRDGLRLPCPPATAEEQISDALYLACRNGQVDVVRYLLSKNPDLSFRAYLGATPLHWACFSGSRAVVDLLTQSGADSTARDETWDCTPRSFGICVAANWGLAHLVRAQLDDDPCLANAMDGRTSPLHEAARNNRLEVVRLLLERGAEPQLQDDDGRTPLDLATERGHDAVTDLLRTSRKT
jgi:ankyrin repeat protein